MRKSTNISKVRIVSAIVGVLFLISAFVPLLHESQVAEHMNELSGMIATPEGRDFSALREINPDTVGWLKVENTNIDTPVVQGDEDFYLNHDFWGESALQGTPFLDTRCAPEGKALLVFGHHIAYTDFAFSCLRLAYTEEVFSSLGQLTWETEGSPPVKASPLCALRVHKSSPSVQTFDFDDSEDFRQWLIALCAMSNVVSLDKDSLISTADRAISLVTCAEIVPNQPWRTVVVFVAPS